MSTYTHLTNNELLFEIGQLLTDEQNTTVANMTIGLQVKLVELDRIKESLVVANPNVAQEVLEDKLANALALAKLNFGSSLAVDPVTQKLAVISMFLSDKVVDHDSFYYERTSSLDVVDRDLEVMLIDATFRKIVNLSETTFDNLEPEMVLEIKRRISGIKSVDSDDMASLTI